MIKAKAESDFWEQPEREHPVLPQHHLTLFLLKTNEFCDEFSNKCTMPTWFISLINLFFRYIFCLCLFFKNEYPEMSLGFRPSERVLFLGEGNFSYSASLLKELITKGAIQDGRNVTVTCYEARYPQCCGAVPILPGSSQSRWRLQLWPRSPQFVAEKKVFYKFSLYRLILCYIIVKFFVYLFL